MKLIDKDALVAEMARQKAQWRICKSTEAKYRREMLDDISSFLDAIEVKEVDLDAELEHYKAEQNIKYEEDINMFEFAKHFFELGLRSTITEEDCKLIWNIGDEIPNMPEEEFFIELLRRYKAQKGEEV